MSFPQRPLAAAAQHTNDNGANTGAASYRGWRFDQGGRAVLKNGHGVSLHKIKHPKTKVIKQRWLSRQAIVNCMLSKGLIQAESDTPPDLTLLQFACENIGLRDRISRADDSGSLFYPGYFQGPQKRLIAAKDEPDLTERAPAAAPARQAPRASFDTLNVLQIARNAAKDFVGRYPPINFRSNAR